ncbi:unnamed protein product [Mytilus coruscus]|uniref:B box-type domain-containing protein n=1 Tax=Mytilus coruscus TaxID=42192 RepID=A0A6J8C977_MYTCO|nr:unnamed protein product [Mytilus coruscus]
MAFASSIQKGQIPVGCELCKGQNKIQFKCIDCELLMCCECMDRVHLRIAKDHQITDIKDIGKHVTFSEIKCETHTGQACCLFCQTCKTFICIKCVAKVHNGHKLIEEEDYNEGKVEIKPKQQSKIKFEISKEYTTDLTSIHFTAVCSDGSIWIGDNTRSKLQHVKLREDRTEIQQMYARWTLQNSVCIQDTTDVCQMDTSEQYVYKRCMPDGHFRTVSVYKIQQMYARWTLQNSVCIQDTTDENKKKYAKVIEQFDKYFIVRRNEAKFNKRKQDDDEGVESFVTSLYTLTEHCGYNDLRQEMIRDRIVVGIKDSNLSLKMQLDPSLLLRKQTDMARQSESVKKQQAIMRCDNPNSNVDAVKSKFNKTKFVKKQKQPFHSQQKAGCQRCGNRQYHPREKMPS